MDSEKPSNESELTSTMGKMSVPNNKEEKTDSNDSTPTSSTDANTNIVGISIVSDDPISSTSSDSDPKKQKGKNVADDEVDTIASDVEPDYLEISMMSGSSSEKITENVDDLVQDLETLLGESADSYSVPVKTKENPKEPAPIENVLEIKDESVIPEVTTLENEVSSNTTLIEEPQLVSTESNVLISKGIEAATTATIESSSTELPSSKDKNDMSQKPSEDGTNSELNISQETKNNEDKIPSNSTDKVENIQICSDQLGDSKTLNIGDANAESNMSQEAKRKDVTCENVGEIQVCNEKTDYSEPQETEDESLKSCAIEEPANFHQEHLDNPENEICATTQVTLEKESKNIECVLEKTKETDGDTRCTETENKEHMGHHGNESNSENTTLSETSDERSSKTNDTDGDIRCIETENNEYKEHHGNESNSENTTLSETPDESNSAKTVASPPVTTAQCLDDYSTKEINTTSQENPSWDEIINKTDEILQKPIESQEVSVPEPDKTQDKLHDKSDASEIFSKPEIQSKKGLRAADCSMKESSFSVEVIETTVVPAEVKTVVDEEVITMTGHHSKINTGVNKGEGVITLKEVNPVKEKNMFRAQQELSSASASAHISIEITDSDISSINGETEDCVIRKDNTCKEEIISKISEVEEETNKIEPNARERAKNEPYLRKTGTHIDKPESDTPDIDVIKSADSEIFTKVVVQKVSSQVTMSGTDIASEKINIKANLSDSEQVGQESSSSIPLPQNEVQHDINKTDHTVEDCQVTSVATLPEVCVEDKLRNSIAEVQGFDSDLQSKEKALECPLGVSSLDVKKPVITKQVDLGNSVSAELKANSSNRPLLLEGNNFSVKEQESMKNTIPSQDIKDLGTSQIIQQSSHDQLDIDSKREICEDKSDKDMASNKQNCTITTKTPGSDKTEIFHVKELEVAPQQDMQPSLSSTLLKERMKDESERNMELKNIQKHINSEKVDEDVESETPKEDGTRNSSSVTPSEFLDKFTKDDIISQGQEYAKVQDVGTLDISQNFEEQGKKTAQEQEVTMAAEKLCAEEKHEKRLTEQEIVADIIEESSAEQRPEVSEEQEAVAHITEETSFEQSNDVLEEQEAVENIINTTSSEETHDISEEQEAVANIIIPASNEQKHETLENQAAVANIYETTSEEQRDEILEEQEAVASITEEASTEILKDELSEDREAVAHLLEENDKEYSDLQQSIIEGQQNEIEIETDPQEEVIQHGDVLISGGMDTENSNLTVSSDINTPGEDAPVDSGSLMSEVQSTFEGSMPIIEDILANEASPSVQVDPEENLETILAVASLQTDSMPDLQEQPLTENEIRDMEALRMAVASITDNCESAYSDPIDSVSDFVSSKPQNSNFISEQVEYIKPIVDNEFVQPEVQLPQVLKENNESLYVVTEITNIQEKFIEPISNINLIAKTNKGEITQSSPVDSKLNAKVRKEETTQIKDMKSDSAVKDEKVEITQSNTTNYNLAVEEAKYGMTQSSVANFTLAVEDKKDEIIQSTATISNSAVEDKKVEPIQSSSTTSSSDVEGKKGKIIQSSATISNAAVEDKNEFTQSSATISSSDVEGKKDEIIQSITIISNSAVDDKKGSLTQSSGTISSSDVEDKKSEMTQVSASAVEDTQDEITQSSPTISNSSVEDKTDELTQNRHTEKTVTMCDSNQPALEEPLSISVEEHGKLREREKPYSPKVKIKPIKVPDDEVSTTSEAEVSKGSLKMTITKQSDKMHSILKVYNPEEDSEPSTEEPIPKLIIKQKLQHVEQQHSPKISTRSTRQVYSPTRSSSPRVTVKPVGKPEVNPLKISIKPVFKADEASKKHSPKVPKVVKSSEEAERVASPKVTIKPIVKPVEFAAEQVHNPKVTIKPITKPYCENENVSSTPKVTIKPIKRPLEDDMSEERPNPKITIKPVLKTSEIEAETVVSKVDSDRASPKISIKPIVKPQESECQTLDTDEEVKERIVLKINKGNLPTPSKESKKREHPVEEEKLAKIKLKFSREGGHPHIVHQDEGQNKRLRKDSHNADDNRKRGHDERMPERSKKPKTGSESPLYENTRSLRHKDPATVDADNSQDDLRIVETKLYSPIVVSSEDSRSQHSADCVIVEEGLDPLDIPATEKCQELVTKSTAKEASTYSAPNVTPPTPPRKRGRPRKVPLEVREEYKEPTPEPVIEKPKIEEPVAVPNISGRPKRSCRGQNVMATLGIKPRKPRGGGKGRGNKVNMGDRPIPMKAEKEPKLSKARLKLMQKNAEELLNEQKQQESQVKKHPTEPIASTSATKKTESHVVVLESDEEKQVERQTRSRSLEKKPKSSEKKPIYDKAKLVIESDEEGKVERKTRSRSLEKKPKSTEKKTIYDKAKLVIESDEEGKVERKTRSRSLEKTPKSAEKKPISDNAKPKIVTPPALKKIVKPVSPDTTNQDIDPVVKKPEVSGPQLENNDEVDSSSTITEKKTEKRKSCGRKGRYKGRNKPVAKFETAQNETKEHIETEETVQTQANEQQPLKEEVTKLIQGKEQQLLKGRVTEHIQAEIQQPLNEEVTEQVEAGQQQPLKEDVTEHIQAEEQPPSKEEATEHIQTEEEQPIKYRVNNQIQGEEQPLKEEIAIQNRSEKQPLNEKVTVQIETEEHLSTKEVTTLNQAPDQEPLNEKVDISTRESQNVKRSDETVEIKTPIVNDGQSNVKETETNVEETSKRKRSIENEDEDSKKPKLEGISNALEVDHVVVSSSQVNNDIEQTDLEEHPEIEEQEKEIEEIEKNNFVSEKPLELEVSPVPASPDSALLAPPVAESIVNKVVLAPVSSSKIPEVVMVDEETRMSSDTSSRAQTPARQTAAQPGDIVEESQSSVQSSATTESSKTSSRPTKVSRLETHHESSLGDILSADQLTEYYWNNNGPFMLQEQVAQYLGIKSFKRKYPGISRRMVDMQERDFIRENGFASEAMCNLGLTAVSSADILDIMFTDFQEKYEEYCKHQRERQAKELINKQKALSQAANLEKSKLDITDQAMQSAAQWNAHFNKARKEQRKASMDLQTLTVHYPKGKIKQINKPKIGHYPVALVPGQFTDYYQEFTPTELNNLPLNTMCYTEINMVAPDDSDDSDDNSDSDSDSSTSSSGSSGSSSSIEDCKTCKPVLKKNVASNLACKQ